MMNLKIKKNRPVLISFLMFLFFNILGLGLTYQKYYILKTNEKQNTLEIANTLKFQLENSLNYSITSAKTLAFIIEKYGIPEDFDNLAQTIIEKNKFLDAIQIVEGEVITKVYPKEGNEVVIGYNVLKDEKVNKEVFKAINAKDIYFAGPIELKQGGMGVIGRYPIFVNGKYFGMSAVIVKLKTLIQVFNIAEESTKNNNFLYQLSKINPNTKEREYFLSDKSFNGDFQSIVEIPNGEWFIHVKPKIPVGFKDIYIYFVLSIFISTLLAYLIYLREHIPIELISLVDQQTKQLATREYFYKQLSENSGDAVIILTQEGGVSFASQSVKNVLGYSVEEISKLNLTEVVHPDDIEGNYMALEESMKNPGVTILGHVSRLKHKDGTWRWYEGTITNMLHDPAFNGIIDNFREITDKVNFIEKIKEKNEKINKLNWMQSHIVRAPLARILGLSNILALSEVEEIKKSELINYIKESAEELDKVIKEIVEQSEKDDDLPLDKTFKKYK
jgi:PAS domain S-box-containing protein